MRRVFVLAVDRNSSCSVKSFRSIVGIRCSTFVGSAKKFFRLVLEKFKRRNKRMAIIQEKGSWFLHDTCGKNHWTIEISDLRNPEEQRCPVCSHKVVLAFNIGAL